MDEEKIIIVYDAECNFLVCNDKYEAAELIKSEIIDCDYDITDTQVYKGIPLDLKMTYKNLEVELIEIEEKD